MAPLWLQRSPLPEFQIYRSCTRVQCLYTTCIYLFPFPPPSLVSRLRLPSPFHRHRFYFAKRVVGRQLFRALRLTAHCAVASYSYGCYRNVICYKQTRNKNSNTKHQTQKTPVLCSLPSSFPYSPLCLCLLSLSRISKTTTRDDEKRKSQIRERGRGKRVSIKLNSLYQN